MKNKILIGTVAFVAVLVAIGILAVSFTMTPALATNRTNVTEKIAINCTTAISVPDPSIDVGAGYIPQICIDCWIGTNITSCEGYTGDSGYYNSSGVAVTVINTKHFTDKCWVNTTPLTLPDSIHIKNKGNNYISLDITLLDDDGWTSQTGSPEFGANALEVFLEQDEASCIDSGIYDYNEASLDMIYTPSVTLCGAMDWAEGKNEVYLFDKFVINPKTEPKQYTLTKEIQATQVQCGGEYTPVDSQENMARADTSGSGPALAVYKTGNSGAWSEFTAHTDSALISAPYSLAAGNGGSGTFMALGTTLGSVDLGTYRYWTGSVFATHTIVGLTNVKWDANTGGATVGGTSIATVNGGAYLLQGKGGSAGQGEVSAVAGTASAGFPGGLTLVGNLCTLYSITCTTTVTPAAIVDMYRTYNAAQHPLGVLGVVFASTAGADSFAVFGANSALTKITQTPITIPGLANSDIVRSAAYSPYSGHLCVWVDAVSGGNYVNDPFDNVSCFILLRNGNDIRSILSIGSWPISDPLGPALSSEMYGLEFNVAGSPPGFIGPSLTILGA
jgi:hypothetical protein